MIFNCDQITKLLLQWQTQPSPELETQILEGCTNLIEALVSKFEPTFRDDLIQECYTRILYASKYYKKEAGSLHNYLTSVINNTCITYITKQSKHISIDDLTDSDESEETGFYYGTVQHIDTIYGDDDLLTRLLERNRKRFPSIPVDEIDSVSEYLYYALKESGSFPKDLPKTLSDNLCIPVTLVRMLCSSSIIWLRFVNLSNANTFTDITEFTLLKDLEEVVDPNTFKVLRIVFSGMVLRIT
jgi:hypothetical protein